MGKQVSPLQFHGRVGNLVGARAQKGYNIMRIRPVSTKNPSTDKQIMQRLKFDAAQNFANKTVESAFAGMVPYAKSLKCSVRNAVVKKSFDDDRIEINGGGAFKPGGENTAKYIIGERFFSVGYTPQGAGAATVTTETPGELQLNNVTSVFPDEAYNESFLLHVIIICDEAKGMIHKVLQRSDLEEAIKFPVPEQWMGLKSETYIYSQEIPNELGTAANYMELYLGQAFAQRKALDSESVFSETVFCGTATIN